MKFESKIYHNFNYKVITEGLEKMKLYFYMKT